MYFCAVIDATMRKLPLLLLLITIIGFGFMACSDQTTYAEQLAAEKAAIKAFIADKGYTVTSTYPDSIPFPEGVFYKTASGLYVHVLDTGLQVISEIPDNTPIEVRFIETDMDGDTIYHNMFGSSDPYEIFYNNVQSSVSYGDCEAWHEALDYVGDGGHVYLIVPTELGMSSYSSSSSDLNPSYYELRYTFWK
jgi:hypothetical protein